METVTQLATRERIRTRLAISPLVPLLALGVFLLRLSWLTRPLMPDEGGYLLVAGQWHAGTSLYGDYWVDRPPLLIALYSLADVGDGRVALRLMGALIAAGCVLLAAALGRSLVPERRSAGLLAAATMAVFLAAPQFGTFAVNGELLGLPFVLTSLLLLSRARHPGVWAGAGAAAAAAVMVKQSLLDGFVIACCYLTVLALRRGLRPAAFAAAAFAAGAVATVVALVGYAWLRGTPIVGLWEAVVTFRLRASEVIAAAGPATISTRAWVLVVAFVFSGAVVVALLGLVPGLGRRGERGSAALDADPRGRVRARTRLVSASDHPDLRLLLVLLLGWELVAVASGGNYWTHYLIGTLPGLVLASLVVLRHRPARLGVLHAVLAVSVTVSLFLVARPDEPSRNEEVIAFLARHAAPGDTATVAFGNAAILQTAGLQSPYPELWSLPVRVRDPRLTQFTRILDDPQRRPTWVITQGPNLATWGVESRQAQRTLLRHYRLVRDVGSHRIYRVDRATYPVPSRTDA